MSIFVSVDSTGSVTNVISVENRDGLSIDKLLPESEEMINADEYPDIAVGWQGSSKGGEWTFTVSQTYQNGLLKDNLSAVRYSHESSGVTVNGSLFLTDRESQAQIASVALAALLDSSYSCKWKTEDGYKSLSANQIISLSSAVRSHVQACFDRESEIIDSINSGSYTESMLTTGWPQ